MIFQFHKENKCTYHYSLTDKMGDILKQLNNSAYRDNCKIEYYFDDRIAAELL
jgi:hypothetical protein